MDGIRTRHGGTEKFLHGCGVAPAAIASFRTKAAQARESAPAAPSGL